MLLGSVASAGTQSALKSELKQELSAKNGWLGDPAKAGFRSVGPNHLKNAELAAKVHSISLAADGVQIYQKAIGKKTITVVDAAMDGVTSRKVFDASGHSLQ
jgi:hypothetical protein